LLHLAFGYQHSHFVFALWRTGIGFDVTVVTDSTEQKSIDDLLGAVSSAFLA
jgi:hypothetical protein